jgi:hypothetical protein
MHIESKNGHKVKNWALRFTDNCHYDLLNLMCNGPHVVNINGDDYSVPVNRSMCFRCTPFLDFIASVHEATEARHVTIVTSCSVEVELGNAAKYHA